MRPEILAPAGDYERLVSAVTFGANAVYLGGDKYGMRAVSASFDKDTLKKAVEFAHTRNVKVYLTCNTLPRNEEINEFPQFIADAVSAGIDAAIVSDIGIFGLVKQHAPNLDIHVSTQAGIVNYASANEFYKMGAKRVVLAREMSFSEIKELREKTDPNLEIEAFVHGAMCMSVSGRCLISQYMVNRDANRGECAQPCRWGFHLVEEKRPNDFYPIYEDENGSHILNAKDMCMIEYIPELVDAGITSFKIEGRAKSSYYVSVITNAYRIAVDEYMKDPEQYKLPEWLAEEVTKVSHRQYSTGFFFGQPENGQYYENGGYLRNFDVVAMVDECKEGYLYCTQRNKFFKGDTVEILEPNKPVKELVITEIINENGEQIENAPHALMKIKIPYKGDLAAGSIIRKEI